MLALFPAIGSLVALYGFVADPGTIASHVDTLNGVLPEGGMEVLRTELTRVSASGRSTLSLAFLVGFAVSLWSEQRGTKDKAEHFCRGLARINLTLVMNRPRLSNNRASVNSLRMGVSNV